MISWRPATRDDVAAVVALLADDVLGATRQRAGLDCYLAAFDAMQMDGNNQLIVGEVDGDVVATYQLAFLSSLSLGAARRAQIEAVRVSSAARGQGLGAALVADTEARAGAAGCTLLQLTSNATRADALRFYEAQGFVASHVGFKKVLSAD